MVEINLKAPPDKTLVDGEVQHCVYYHFESSEELRLADHGKTGRLLNPPATPFWQAIGIGLVDFFGGEVDFDDSDSTEFDYVQISKTNRMNCPESGADWEALQIAKAEVKPIKPNKEVLAKRQ